MSKRAFTVVEILIVLFLVLMIASIIVPMNVANVRQAEMVAKWKNVYPEADYSFKLLRAQHSELFDTLGKNHDADSSSVFNTIKAYLNVSEEKSSPKYFEHYKFKFLNGRSVGKKSRYYVKDFATLQSGVIIGFRLNEYRFVGGGEPLGIMLFDINGLAKPNRIGKDIFGVNVFPMAIVPFGEGRSSSDMKANCSPIGVGVMCSKFYLIGGNF